MLYAMSRNNLAQWLDNRRLGFDMLESICFWGDGVI